MAYLLDANVFIVAKRLYYGFDVCRAFWYWPVFSVEKVEEDVMSLGDVQSEWARRVRSGGSFLSTDPSLVPSTSAVTSWARAQNYEPEAVNTFLQVADCYLEAQAHSGGQAVVTHEVPSGSICTIKIPSTCIGLGIKTMPPFQMQRRAPTRFVLGAAS